MKPLYHIRTRRLKDGRLAYDLDYFATPGRKGQRYRPLLGYNLTDAEAHALAQKCIEGLQRRAQGAVVVSSTQATLSTMLPVYWAAFDLRRRVDHIRPEITIRKHLLPYFGDRRLSSFTYADGLAYIHARREQGAQDGTIQREWHVLMRLLNLAVVNEQLDRNRLATVPVPHGTKRQRVANVDELLAIQWVASEELWRIVTVALNTGLRLGVNFAFQASWCQRRDEGWWCVPPPPRTASKSHPRIFPLNSLALTALHLSQTKERVWSWGNIKSVKRAWVVACERARITDLHFHDLRHTFATRLQGLGVGYEIRQTLLGHAMQGQTQAYSHGSTDWNQYLRQAVEALDLDYRRDGVVYAVVNGPVRQPKVVGLDSYKSRKTQGKCRYLQIPTKAGPCRNEADTDEEKQ